MDTAERRQNLKDALIVAAERAIAAHGLAGLKARELAAEAGCAVGAIYNAVEDLDELVLAVNSRTLAALERALDAAKPAGKAVGAERAIAQLSRMAIAYLDYAASNTPRWRALFEHRLAAGRDVPDWYRAVQAALFAHVETPLQALRPDLTPRELALLARSVFSAVHGIVALGLEEKLGTVPLRALRTQITVIVAAIGAGLARPDSGRISSR
jgi:AcrR family transcriptional regulator